MLSCFVLYCKVKLPQKHSNNRTWVQVDGLLCFCGTYGRTRWWQTGPDVGKLCKRWWFSGRGYMTLLAIKTQGWVPFTERISPTFNLTLLLLQALDVAYRASHCGRLTELLRTIWHTTPGNRLFSTAQPSCAARWNLHTDEVRVEGLLFPTCLENYCCYLDSLAI